MADYKLGKYDTAVDNGDGTVTITRQTGYITTNDLVNGYWQGTSATGYLYQLDGWTFSNATFINNQLIIKSADYMWTNTTQAIGYSDQNHKLNIRIDGVTSVSALKNWIQNNGLYIQYKMTTTITEKVLSNMNSDKPVLLWANPDPSSDYGTSSNGGYVDATFSQNASIFKYLVILYRAYKGSGTRNKDYAPYIKKVQNDIGGKFNIWQVYAYYNNKEICARELTINSTYLRIGNCYHYENNELYNHHLIPMAIYGTNTL